jgi:hypothetical protein
MIHTHKKEKKRKEKKRKEKKKSKEWRSEAICMSDSDYFQL